MLWDIPPVAVAAYEVFKLSIGLLFQEAALFLHPAGDLVTRAGGYGQLVMHERAPLLFDLPAELHPKAVKTIPVHFVSSLSLPAVEAQIMTPLKWVSVRWRT